MQLLLTAGNGEAANVGHEAHIVGESVQGPRGESSLTEIERNDYSNLILLCRNHHGVVDDAALAADFPIEKLHAMKAFHETWVDEHLTELEVDRRAEAADLVYAALVDEAVARCRLASWRNWTEPCLGPTPGWYSAVIEDIVEFKNRVDGAVFFGRYPRLESAIIRFAHVLNAAAMRFLDQASNDQRIDFYRGNQFYRERRNMAFLDATEKLEKLYEVWLADCYERVYESTRAANWFADEVRDSLDPKFFAVEGRFALEEQLVLDQGVVRVLQYSDDQRARYTEGALLDFEQPQSLMPQIIAVLDEDQRRRI